MARINVNDLDKVANEPSNASSKSFKFFKLNF